MKEDLRPPKQELLDDMKFWYEVIRKTKRCMKTIGTEEVSTLLVKLISCLSNASGTLIRNVGKNWEKNSSQQSGKIKESCERSQTQNTGQIQMMMMNDE